MCLIMHRFFLIQALTDIENILNMDLDGVSWIVIGEK